MFFGQLTPPLRNWITSRKYMSIHKKKKTNKHINMVLIENFRVSSCNHDNFDRYRGYKQVQVILIFQTLFPGSFVLITSHSSIKIRALFATIQVKSSQFKSNYKKNKINKSVTL